MFDRNAFTDKSIKSYAKGPTHQRSSVIYSYVCEWKPGRFCICCDMSSFVHFTSAPNRNGQITRSLVQFSWFCFFLFRFCTAHSLRLFVLHFCNWLAEYEMCVCVCVCNFLLSRFAYFDKIRCSLVDESALKWNRKKTAIEFTFVKKKYKRKNKNRN